MSIRKQQEAPPTRGVTHLDGVDQVLDQEEAPQLADGLVELGQSQVTVLVHQVLRERHLLVQVLPVGGGGKRWVANQTEKLWPRPLTSI